VRGMTAGAPELHGNQQSARADLQPVWQTQPTLAVAPRPVSARRPGPSARSRRRLAVPLLVRSVGLRSARALAEKVPHGRQTRGGRGISATAGG
jgi:hypothetical protein